VSELESALEWRVERALQLAWPALEQQICGDWLARFAPGVSRRSNSANPLRAHLRHVDADIAACEQAFHVRGQPAMFRVPAIVETSVDERLDRRNYQWEGESVTLYGELEADAERDAGVTIASRPVPAWLAAMAELQRHTPEQAAIYAGVVRAIALSAGFVGLREEGEWAALAYGAVHDGLLCCESVIAHPQKRGRGLARRMMKALFAWAAARGARAVCLQVAADNGPGLALYRNLGLKTVLYRYHYRREATGR